MPFFVAAIMDGLEWLLASRLGQFILNAVGWLGMSFAVQHVVVQPALDKLQTLANGNYGGGSWASLVIAWLGLLNFDKAISMIISAVATKYAATASKIFLQKKTG